MTDKLSDKDKKLWLDHMKQPNKSPPQEIEDFAALLDNTKINNDDGLQPTKKTPLPIIPNTKNKHDNNEPLDTSIARKLSQGKIKPEGKLDLHGLTQQEAYIMLCDYIEHSYNQNKKYVLIVTGKGKNIKQPQDWFTPRIGVLKQKLPHWIKTRPLQHYVIDAITAHPKHGGGAFYVILKKKK